MLRKLGVGSTSLPSDLNITGEGQFETKKVNIFSHKGIIILQRTIQMAFTLLFPSDFVYVGLHSQEHDEMKLLPPRRLADQ